MTSHFPGSAPPLWRFFSFFSLSSLMTISPPPTYGTTHRWIIPNPALLFFFWALDHYIKLPSRHQHPRSQSPIRSKKCKSKLSFSFSQNLFPHLWHRLSYCLRKKTIILPLRHLLPKSISDVCSFSLPLVQYPVFHLTVACSHVHHLFYLLSIVFLSSKKHKCFLVNLRIKRFINRSCGNSQNEARSLCWRQDHSQNCARKTPVWLSLGLQLSSPHRSFHLQPWMRLWTATAAASEHFMLLPLLPLSVSSCLNGFAMDLASKSKVDTSYCQV